MPGKHAPASPRSFYTSVGKALGAAVGAVGLMVAAVLILLSRGGGIKEAGSPAIESPSPTVSTKHPTPRPSLTPTPSPTATILAVADVTVHVQNGTSRTGLAARTADKIRAQGYKVVRVDNDGTLAKSTIFYSAGHRAEALAFRRAFKDFTVLRERDNPGGEILRVVVGSDYP